MLELGCRQSMTGMETKRARGKCIANALVLSALLNFLVQISKHATAWGIKRYFAPPNSGKISFGQISCKIRVFR